ncbi:unnamed protein product [Protopolystoma xenopodis]|uniref:Uncharacterized protein n=1 Tax=Protopolystoma xenopodis TaxID=117903 RepID=A0A448WQT0_9PLAT|nr:unnamed protein product [Protopolystoma xenopodis]
MFANKLVLLFPRYHFIVSRMEASMQAYTLFALFSIPFFLLKAPHSPLSSIKPEPLQDASPRISQEPAQLASYNLSRIVHKDEASVTTQSHEMVSENSTLFLPSESAPEKGVDHKSTAFSNDTASLHQSAASQDLVRFIREKLMARPVISLDELAKSYQNIVKPNSIVWALELGLLLGSRVRILCQPTEKNGRFSTKAVLLAHVNFRLGDAVPSFD